MTCKMVKGNSHIQMGLNIKELGRQVNNMGKEFTQIKDKARKDSGIMDKEVIGLLNQLKNSAPL